MKMEGGKLKSLSLSLLIALSAGAFLSFVVEAFVSCDVSALTQHSISISTDVRTLESTINTDPEGSMIIQKHVVTLNTDNPDGLKLFVSAKDNKTTPTYVAGSGPAGASGLTVIGRATGSGSNPAVLSTNTFGFATAKETDVKYDKFSSQSVYESTNESVRRQAKFGKLEELKYSYYPFYMKKGTHVNKQIPIYYGTNVNSLMREGKYEVDVIYTLISHDFLRLSSRGNSHMEYEPKRMLVRDDQNFYGDNTVTIRTDIKSNRPIEADRVSVTVGYKKCTDVNITQNFSENADKNLEVTCKAPKNLGSSAGVEYAIVIEVDVGLLETELEDYFGIKYVIPETMQGFQHSQCAAMQTHEEKTLVDTRDGQLYTVAKLKDGKCWMTQNLRLKLDTSTPLKPEDSDVTANWTPNRSTETTLTGRWDQDSEGKNTIRSYYNESKQDLGVYYTQVAAKAGDVYGYQQSVCPKGWKLPDQNNYHDMMEEYKGTAVWDGTYSFKNGNHELFSGAPKFITNGTRAFDKPNVVNDESDSDLWTSGRISYDWAYLVTAKNNQVAYYAVYMHPHFGMGVRCVARY